MKRLKLLDTAPIPGGAELALYELGEDFVIKVVGGQDLMSTRTHGSAEALARARVHGGGRSRAAPRADRWPWRRVHAGRGSAPSRPRRRG